jgi:hypothetical protein
MSEDEKRDAGKPIKIDLPFEDAVRAALETSAKTNRPEKNRPRSKQRSDQKTEPGAPHR